MGCSIQQSWRVTMKKRLHSKKIKQRLQDDMIANVWDGNNQDKRRIMKMSNYKMIKELNEKWRKRIK